VVIGVSDRLARFIERLAEGVRLVAERLPVVLADPGAYPREAAALLVAGVLLLAQTVAVVALLVDAVQLAARRRGGARRFRPHRFLADASMIGLALAVLATVAALAPAAPAVSRWCGACHAMASVTAAWQADAHREVSCYACHARPGLIGMVQAGSVGAARLLGGKRGDVPTSIAFERRCLRCHVEVVRGVTTGSIRMRHEDVVAVGYECTTCHPWAGHTTARPTMPIARSRMTICFGCHDGATAPSSCTLCHDGPPDESAAVPPGDVARGVRCTGCHSAETEDRCASCHDGEYGIGGAQDTR
jgi:predicted CXXCH cytochrome family protein